MLGMIPLPYKLLAGAALVAGIFFYGYMKGSAYADAELARYGQKQAELVAELEKKNTEISTQVVTEYVDIVQFVKEKEYVYRDVAQNVVPNQFTVSNGWVYTHDTSARADNADAAELLMRPPQELQTLRPSSESSETTPDANKTPSSSDNSSNG